MAPGPIASRATIAKPVKPRGKVNCMPAPSYIRNEFARQSEDSRVDEGCLVMLAGPIQ